MSPVLVPEFRDLITYLVETKEGEILTKRDAVLGVKQLLMYLNVCSLHPTLPLSPSLRVDNLWHALLQFPVLYSGICSHLPGGVIVPHNPRLSLDSESVKCIRYGKARELIITIFHPHSSPCAAYWPLERSGLDLGIPPSPPLSTFSPLPASPAEKITFSLTFGCKRRKFKASRGAKVLKLKLKAAEYFGIKVCTIRLFFCGDILNDNDDLSSLEEGDDLDVMLAQTGC